MFVSTYCCVAKMTQLSIADEISFYNTEAHFKALINLIGWVRDLLGLG